MAKTAAKTVRAVNREQWLEHAVRALRPHFRAAGVELPRSVRVSVGWPGGRAKKQTIGQAWSPASAADGRAQVFISPVVADAATALGVLVHELVHVADRNEHGHGPVFAKMAAAVGLVGKPTATVPGGPLALMLDALAKRLGKYPHAALTDGRTTEPKKQTTRMVKVECDTCGYTVRTTAKWLAVATPVCPDPDCPDHGNAMVVGGAGEGEAMAG